MIDKKDLELFIAFELHELAWRYKYPISENIALWSVINALQDNGFKANFKKDPLEVFYVFSQEDEQYELSASISRLEILKGWKLSPKASLTSLYNSCYLIIDRLQENIKGVYPEYKHISNAFHDTLEKERSKKGTDLRKSMEGVVLSYFEKYFEQVFQPSSIDYDAPFESGILNDLIESDMINLDRINEAITSSKVKMDNSEFGMLTNAYFSIRFLKDRIPPPSNHVISESNIFDYVWGIFLLKLAKLKGYKVKQYNEDDFEENGGMLEIAYDSGWDILEPLV